MSRYLPLLHGLGTVQAMHSKNQLHLVISTAIFFAASVAACLIVAWLILHDADKVALLTCSILYVFTFRVFRDTRVALKKFLIIFPSSPWFAKFRRLISKFSSADQRTTERPPSITP